MIIAIFNIRTHSLVDHAKGQFSPSLLESPGSFLPKDKIAKYYGERGISPLNLWNFPQKLTGTLALRKHTDLRDRDRTAVCLLPVALGPLSVETHRQQGGTGGLTCR